MGDDSKESMNPLEAQMEEILEEEKKHDKSDDEPLAHRQIREITTQVDKSVSASLSSGQGAFLTKQGRRIKTWKKKFMLVRTIGDSPYILYFKNEVASDVNESAASGKIRLHKAVIRPVADHVTKKENAFAVKPTDGEREFVLHASTGEERESWIQHLLLQGCIWENEPFIGKEDKFDYSFHQTAVDVVKAPPIPEPEFHPPGHAFFRLVVSDSICKEMIEKASESEDVEVRALNEYHAADWTTVDVSSANPASITTFLIPFSSRMAEDETMYKERLAKEKEERDAEKKKAAEEALSLVDSKRAEIKKKMEGVKVKKDPIPKPEFRCNMKTELDKSFEGNLDLNFSWTSKPSPFGEWHSIDGRNWSTFNSGRLISLSVCLSLSLSLSISLSLSLSLSLSSLSLSLYIYIYTSICLFLCVLNRCSTSFPCLFSRISSSLSVSSGWCVAQWRGPFFSSSPLPLPTHTL